MSTIPPKPDIYSGWFEPESAANTETQPSYRYNHTIETPRGHLFEMDDTPGRERIRFTHRANTFIELHPNGDGTFKIFGDGYHIVMGDYNIGVGVDDGKNAHKMNITVYGDVNMHVTGDKVETIDGNYEQHVKGHYKQFVEKTSTIQSQGDMIIGGGYSQAGSVTIQTGDTLIVDASLSVAGEITAQKITSRTRVDAVLGMSAGVDGFVTEFGGVAAGLPAASPLQVTAATNMIAGASVNAGVAVNSPQGNFGTMQAVLMTDSINTAIYNSHIHQSPKGPTSPPAPGPMV
jgi:hypothetical protein